jgi:hypothetical protein
MTRGIMEGDENASEDQRLVLEGREAALQRLRARGLRAKGPGMQATGATLLAKSPDMHSIEGIC